MELSYERKNAYDVYSKEELRTAFDYCEGYKKFINDSKTERLAVKTAIAMAEKEGFEEFVPGKKYPAGSKVYLNQKKKAAIFAVIGKKPLTDGFLMTAAHIDSPRLDLKPNPLYQDGNLALMKSHYYGGLRKYQWVTIPLALCGTVCKKNGESIDIEIGNSENDPVFYITDLLPHLAKKQAEKRMAEAIPAENLNIVIGSIPSNSEDKDRFVMNFLDLIYKKYGITQADFFTADLSVVPADNARDVGLDRSMIAAYGHDDRICAYPAFSALLEMDSPEKTCIALLADREEVGSMGITGMKCRYFDMFIEDLCLAEGCNVNAVYRASSCISTDVAAAFDPTYQEVFDKNSAAYLNFGIVLSKYTGGGGKSGASEACPEYMAKLCAIFEEANAMYQFHEMGKVDAGGGGTVSQYIANRNIDVVDIGVPMLSMHAPIELAAKADIYSMYKAMKAFYTRA